MGQTVTLVKLRAESRPILPYNGAGSTTKSRRVKAMELTSNQQDQFAFIIINRTRRHSLFTSNNRVSVIWKREKLIIISEGQSPYDWILRSGEQYLTMTHKKPSPCPPFMCMPQSRNRTNSELRSVTPGSLIAAAITREYNLGRLMTTGVRPTKYVCVSRVFLLSF
jgi:hypothetical protein